MNIVENSKLTGGSSTNTLSGSIVFDEALGEFRQTKMVNGEPVVVFRMDGSGIHYYDDYGNIKNVVDANGTHFYDANGTERISIGLSSEGMMRMLFRNSNGTAKILIGQNPKDGSPVVAVTKPDDSSEAYDVESELLV